MRIAWPELIVLIVFGTLLVFAVEIGVLMVAKEYHASGLVVVPLAVAMLFFDLWAILRTIDWAFAGPARRAKQRVL